MTVSGYFNNGNFREYSYFAGEFSSFETGILGGRFPPSQRHAGGAAPPSLNLRPPHISETTKARKLKFYRY